MVSNLFSRTRVAPLPHAVEAGVWIGGITAASVLTRWLTDELWPPAVVGVALMLLAARRSVKMVSRLQAALANGQQERATMEQALRRAQKMEALGRLTVGVAHDFNNHLTVISSNVEMVGRRLDPAQGKLLRHTDAALQGVRRAAILTGRLLSFSRQPAVEREAVDVDRLIGGLADLLQRALSERIGLEVRLSGSPWYVWADVNQMESALLSLTMNARDQVSDGGVLSLVVSNVTLDTVFADAHPSIPPGDYIQIAVSGSMDLAEAKQPEPACEMTSADLFMARAFVREAGGCLLCSDPAREGLSLRLFLPRYVPPSVAKAGGSCRAGRRTTVLVVEDDAALREVCTETLRGVGYEVLEAPDAMEAFRLIADHGGIDLLFTDLGLPGGVSGRALADAARNVDTGMRVLFTTGYERAELPEGSALLRKPFNPAQLAGRVRDVLAAERPMERSETVQG